MYTTLLIITVHPLDEGDSFKVGWVLLAVPFSSLIYSIFLMIRETVLSLKKECKKCKQKKKVAALHNTSALELKSRRLPPLEEPEAETPPRKHSSYGSKMDLKH